MAWDQSVQLESEQDSALSLKALIALQRLSVSNDMPIETKLRELLSLGSEIFALPFGAITRIQDKSYRFELVHSPPGWTPSKSVYDLSETYCFLAYEKNSAVGFHHAGDCYIRDLPCYKEFGLEAYIGAPLIVDGSRYGTVAFADYRPLSHPFSNSQLSLIMLFAQWVGSELTRKGFQDRLVSREEHTRLILNSVGAGIVELNLDGSINFVNSVACQMLGYRTEQLVARPFDALLQAHDTSSLARHLTARLMHAIVDGKPFNCRDLAMQGADGRRFPVELISHPIYDQGQVISAVVSFQDITERQRNEKLKNEFVSTVSHELRTPLTSIMGSLDLLRSGIVGEQSPEAAQMLSISYKNSERLVRLINDILDIEKIESGKFKLNCHPVNLMELVEETIMTNQSYAAEHQVAFAITQRLETARVEGDPDKLAQVLTNFLSNAAKFSPPGGQVEVAVCRRRGRIRVSVTDHGEGIPEAFHPRLFQKFTQADSSDKRRQGGTGLGLSICKAIVALHRGHVGFETAPGQGTTFYFDLDEI